MEPSLPNGEPTIAKNDWRNQLPSDLRQITLNKILEKIKEQLPFAGQERIEEVKRIATQLEEEIFTLAVSQDDYVHQTFLKLADSSSIPAGGLTNNDNLKSSLPKKEPAKNAYNWRADLPQDSRLKNIEKLVDRAMEDNPNAEQEKTNELMDVAIRLEQASFNIAASQEEYYSRIMERMGKSEEESILKVFEAVNGILN